MNDQTAHRIFVDHPAYNSLCHIAPRIEMPDSLLQAAVAVSQIEHEVYGWATADDKIQKMADSVRDLRRQHFGDRAPTSSIASLHEHLYKEQGFSGIPAANVMPQHYCVSVVLKIGHGMPESVGIIYKTIAHSIGLKCRAMGLKSMFFFEIIYEDGIARYIHPTSSDPGKCFNRAQIEDQYTNEYGSDTAYSADAFEEMSNRVWISRMLDRMRYMYIKDDPYRALVATQMLITLWPTKPIFWRDASYFQQKRNDRKAAADCLDKYLERVRPEDVEDYDKLVQTRHNLRSS